MRVLFFLLQKEFKQIFRDKALLPMIFLAPIIQLLVMPLAADYEIKNINIAIVDHEHSTYSQKLINKITASGYFVLSDYDNSFNGAFEQIESDKADLILEIPKNFEKDLSREGSQKLFIAVNAINGTKANLGGAYLARIIADFNAEIRLDWRQQSIASNTQIIEIVPSNWYNPLLNYSYFMVPGILATLVTMIAVYMCALNIVKEKEIGTIEQINVTPIKKIYFILGKLIPFWIIGNVVFTVGLFIVAHLIYGIVPLGSVLLLYGYLAVFLVVILGIGLLISTYSETQQQAMSLAFFCMMVFMLMGGLFTPIESMPEWAKIIANLNPVTYFIEVMRMVVLKGSQFADLKKHFLIMFGFALFFNTWAVLNYKKTN
ncbi:ABC transporter permease [Flavobacterium sp. TAB 87]|uniref:ABC transporter permease n=1 Tax=Flavobacterium sp. TAB 87 TaxID=1729581 RepID=UPI00076D8A87|nr:ABC transporter permease [Flavobacterium sp. TAB 87]KVV14995.1 Inner membrane transport permease YbhR [Flavobacterium sp. TAB 87]